MTIYKVSQLIEYLENVLENEGDKFQGASVSATSCNEL